LKKIGEDEKRRILIERRKALVTWVETVFVHDILQLAKHDRRSAEFWVQNETVRLMTPYPGYPDQPFSMSKYGVDEIGWALDQIFPDSEVTVEPNENGMVISIRIQWD